MPGYLLSPVANARLDDIYRYTKGTWGEAQADDYIRTLFHCSERIAAREIPWKIVPAEFEV